MIKRQFFYVLFLALLFLCSCESKKKDPIANLKIESFRQSATPFYVIDKDKIREMLRQQSQIRNNSNLQDSAIYQYYSQKNVPFLWISHDDNYSQCDTLLNWLEKSSVHGLNPEMFSTSKIKANMERLKNLDLNKDTSVNELLADLEFDLSKAYLRYTCGINFGFINPVDSLNNHENDEDKSGKVIKEENGKLKKKKLYNIPLQKCNQEFIRKAMDVVKSDIGTFLSGIQPKDRFYLRLQEECFRIDSLGDIEFEKIPEIGELLIKVGEVNDIVPSVSRRLAKTGEYSGKDTISNVLSQELLDAVNQFRKTNYIAEDNSIGSYTVKALNRPMRYYKDRVRINLERLRWKPKLEKGDKYIMVNTAAYMLQAFDAGADSILEMRVCCGSAKNKTPLLSSRINYIEMNPYWNVPKSIIRKEMIPAYRKDSAYFRKNRLKIYDKEGKRLDPHNITWSKYKGEVPFDIKQDNKVGNSLGRLIFRFPNLFSVYLHDTPSRWAFMRSNRAVSHGCVRLEKALDFAFFLLKDKDDVLMDRIRVAIDLPAKTVKGKEVVGKPGYQELKNHTLKESLPLFLDYYTMFYSKDGTLSYCEDIYNFDKPLLQNLDSLN